MDNQKIARQMLRLAKELTGGYSFSQFEKALRTHDWTYQMSDDFRYWGAGEKQRKLINQMARELVGVDPKRVEQLYNKYAKAGLGDLYRPVKAEAWIDQNKAEREQKKYVSGLKKTLRKVGSKFGRVTKEGSYETSFMWTYYAVVELDDGSTVTLSVSEYRGGTNVEFGHYRVQFKGQSLRPGSLSIRDIEKALLKKSREVMGAEKAAPRRRRVGEVIRIEKKFEKIGGLIWGLSYTSDKPGPSDESYKQVDQALRLFKKAQSNPLLRPIIKEYLKGYDHMTFGFQGGRVDSVGIKRRGLDTKFLTDRGWQSTSSMMGRDVYRHPDTDATIMVSDRERFILFTP